jgi:NAD+-dependent protein deacetylase sirtuin 2
MTGAGISVSAGIPDFRTPGSGLYDNLQEYNLPYPEAIFTLDYFLKKPEPFYKFMMHFDIEKYNATPTHYFVKMLHDKKIMLRNLT